MRGPNAQSYVIQLPMEASLLISVNALIRKQ